MDPIESAIKLARECHTKVAWEDFLSTYGDLLASCTQPRLVAEIFKRLEEDPQSLNYNPNLWAALLQGSMASWSLEVGCRIAEFSKRLPVAAVAVAASQVLLEGGYPAASRELAQRAIRVSTLSSKEHLQLDMMIASSFAEEGKVEKAVRILGKIGPSVRESDLSLADRADFLHRLGRLNYFIGRYTDAAKAFEEAAPLFLQLKDWETAARSLFNVGACYQNSGEGMQSDAFRMVEECRRLAVEHNLPGPLSHCESFYGLEGFHAGNFASARDHFRRALSVLPANDKSFRRLHILSMLSLTYFWTGKYALARKFAEQTLSLAALDESDRFKVRYRALEAEMLWEEGKIPESMEILQRSLEPFDAPGIHTLEELLMLTRYNVQTAICGRSMPNEKYKIAEGLSKNKNSWLEYQYSRALLKTNSANTLESSKAFQECLIMARNINAQQYEALCLIGLINDCLRRHAVSETPKLITELEIVASRLGDSPMKPRLQLIYAGIAYQEGDFERCVKILTAVEKMSAVSFPDMFAVQCCLATIQGHSPRLTHEWQIDLVARFVRNYFAPNIAIPEPRVFVISNHYTVNLEKHPALAELLTYLIDRPITGATPANVQVDVWKQSVNAQGWQQKIRNAIMRLRDLFPYSIAPILLHDDSGIRFFASAISLNHQSNDLLSDDVIAKRILAESPLSSQQLSDRMGISLATAKRILKKLSEDEEVKVEKHGRNVLYAVMKNRHPSLHSQTLH